MEQHFKILKPVTFNMKNLASLCLTADEVVQGAGKRASTVQLMGSFYSGNRLQPFWISHNKRKPIPSSQSLYQLLRTQSTLIRNQRAAISTPAKMDDQAIEVQQRFLDL